MFLPVRVSSLFFSCSWGINSLTPVSLISFEEFAWDFSKPIIWTSVYLLAFSESGNLWLDNFYLFFKTWLVSCWVFLLLRSHFEIFVSQWFFLLSYITLRSTYLLSLQGSWVQNLVFLIPPQWTLPGAPLQCWEMQIVEWIVLQVLGNKVGQRGLGCLGTDYHFVEEPLDNPCLCHGNGAQSPFSGLYPWVLRRAAEGNPKASWRYPQVLGGKRLETDTAQNKSGNKMRKEKQKDTQGHCPW